MKLRVSTWACLAVLVLTNLLIAVPQAFFPSSWTSNSTGGDYGITPREFLRGLLLVVLVAELAVILLYAAIRSALRPDFRRDGLVLGAGGVLLLLGWIAVLFFGVG